MAVIVNFGSYPQNGSGKKPIEWQILDVSGDEALLVSCYGIDSRQYNSRFMDVTWENCDLRKWLNHDFLKAAFTEEEQQRIKFADVPNDDNPRFGACGGNDTRDRVFCLSLAEAERYFKDDSERECWPTALALYRGLESWHGSCFWWLRSPGSSLTYASYVYTNGDLSHLGCSILDDLAVRPALRVNLGAVLARQR